ncbi:hypothetical protein [Cellulosimicrobium cellulans]|uniref:hypothetical protein n=1 Tax=Cellulosimicrobium cellulans TaxID=1710 RepID=UPI003821E5A8
MTPRERWLASAAPVVFALLALALTRGTLDGDPAGLAWYYGVMFPWASLGTSLMMLVLIAGPATEAPAPAPALDVPVILLAGATQGAVAAAIVLRGRTWCARRRSMRAVRADDPLGAATRARPSDA